MPQKRPRTFQLFRGKSDLGVLFLVLVFGAVIIIAPAMASWMLRGLFVIALAVLGWIIILMRRLDGADRGSSPWSGALGLIAAMVVLIFWGWRLYKMFAGGAIVDASLLLVFICECVYFFWLKRNANRDESKDGPMSGPAKL